MWLQGSVSEQLDKLLTLHQELKKGSFADWQGTKPLICFNFGSLASSGVLPEPRVLFKLLTKALEQAGAKGILLTGALAASAPLLCSSQIEIVAKKVATYTTS